jgi:transcription elongation factor Elf1
MRARQPSFRRARGRAVSCDCRLREVFECPVCGRQTAVLTSEPVPAKPFICDSGHRTVEMEQRLPDAFRTEFQDVDWERDFSEQRGEVG